MIECLGINADKMNQYRTDIDGLRAIAVLSVIVFHLNESWLIGGFIGVDIFFVISGFLITSQIREHITDNKFSFKSFYLRRIRRIAPALLMMLLVCTLISLVYFPPEMMVSFANSLTYQVLSLQNFVFLSEGDYFVNGNVKPLLHTWSLAVEEQFYLIWPALLIILSKFPRRYHLFILSIIISSSFFLNIILISISPKSSFFLLPTRAWELAVGGIATVLLEKKIAAEHLHPLLTTCLSWLGVTLVIGSLFAVSSKVAFPGWIASLPVLGTFMLLVGGAGKRGLIYSILSFPIMVWIGLLSYSLYLWHWPVLVFIHTTGELADPIKLTVVLCFISTLSLLSYRYVESPIRKRTLLQTPKQLITAVMVISIGLSITALHIQITDGASYRYNRMARPYLTASFNSQSTRCGFLFRMLHSRTEVCQLVSEGNERKILLWGNSHADMWSKMLSDLANASQSALYLNVKNCRPSRDSYFCNEEVQRKIIDKIKSAQISDVVLASTWHGSYEIKDEIFEKEMELLVDKLRTTGTRVWFVIDPPVGVELDPLNAYKKNHARPVPGHVASEEYKATRYFKAMNLALKLKNRFREIRVIDPSQYLCNLDRCYAGDDTEVWYRDSNHLTNDGAKKAMPAFEPIFK